MKRLFIYVLTITLILGIYNFPSAQATTLKPVIIVLPGVMGSQLDIEGTVKWPPNNPVTGDDGETEKDVIGLFKFTNTGYKALSCYYGSSTNEPYCPGEPIYEISNTIPVKLNYSKLINNLKNSYPLYEVVSFGYDWRHGVNYNAELLEAKIKNQYLGREIYLVGHSMGGLIMMEYLRLLTNEGVAGYAQKQLIQNYITVGTPYLGAPKSLLTISTGNVLGWQADVAGITSKLKLLVPNISSAYQLFPSNAYYDSDSYAYTIQAATLTKEYQSGYYIDKWENNKILGYENSKSYLINNHSIQNPNDSLTLIASSSYYINPLLVDKADKFQSNFQSEDQIKSIFNGVRNINIIAGKGMSTPLIIRFLNGAAVGASTIKKTTLGDGTVPLRSAKYLNRCINVNYTEVTGIKHAELMNDINVIAAIKTAINSGTVTIADANPSLNNLSNYEIHVDCPVNVNVTDESGKVLYNPNADVEDELWAKIEKEYPNATDDEMDQYWADQFPNGKIEDGFYDDAGKYLPKFISLVADRKYDINISGYDNGIMDYRITKETPVADASGENYDLSLSKATEYVFNDVPITPQTRITTNTDFTKVVTLSLDSNGDGIIDQIIQPTTTITDADYYSQSSPTNLTVNLKGTEGNDGWYKSPVEVSISGQDRKKINQVEYILDGNSDQKDSDSSNENNNNNGKSK